MDTKLEDDEPVKMLVDEAMYDDDEELPAIVRETVERSGKNPISLFSEMFVQLYQFQPNMEFFARNCPEGLRFVCIVEIDSEKIESRIYPNKKKAKLSCALKGIAAIINRLNSHFEPEVKFESDSTFYELMREHTYAKYYELCSDSPTIYGLEKVIASVFIKMNDELRIVSLATGNKCLRGENIVLDGTALIDCHAEILARRGLLRFLYSEILKCLAEPEASILVHGGKIVENRFVLRPGTTFHLFINTAPCGAGRILKKVNENKPDEVIEASKMRFKIDKGMGTVYGNDEEFEDPQTFDGILIGERMRTMSCSDKLLRTSVLGVQGALLSYFMEPIYYTTIAVADKNDPKRLHRAVCGRVKGLVPPPPFQVPNVIIGQCQVDDSEQSSSFGSRSTARSANWNIADGTVEVVYTSDGLVHDMEVGGEKKTYPSRLCKKELADLMIKTCDFAKIDYEDRLTYESLKAGSKNYNNAKTVFNKWIKQHELGIWQQKPRDFQLFQILQ